MGIGKQFLMLKVTATMALITMFAGCKAGGIGSDSKLRIVGRVLPPTTDRDQHRLDEVLRHAKQRDFERASSLILSFLEEQDPFLITVGLGKVATWAKSSGRAEMISPLVERCIASSDPMIRWAGYDYADLFGDESSRIRSLLRKDYDCILIRPDPTPWLKAPFAYWMRRWHAAGTLSQSRVHVIELLEKHEIVEAIQVLETIATDRNEWYVSVKSTAAKALRTLRNSGDRTTTYGDVE